MEEKMGKKIISFSLWGNKDLYNYGALSNVDEAKEIYPDWICRFYVHNRSPVIDQLRAKECEVIPMDIEQQWAPLFWRFNAISDPDVDFVLFRDCDSRVNWREEGAVREWLKTDKILHLMKDYPAPHATETILAGMWGMRGHTITNMSDLIKTWINKSNMSNKYVDQDFLRCIIWPMFKHSVLNHGVKSPAGEAIPFPPHKPMKYGEYVGMVIAPGTKPKY